MHPDRLTRSPAALTPIAALVALVALIALLAAAAPAAAIDFGAAEQGEIRTLCVLFCFGENCSQSGTVSSLAVDPPFFVRGIRTGANDPDLCNVGGTTPATLPVTLAQGQRLFFDVDMVATEQGNFDSLLQLNQQTLADLEGQVVPALPCTPSDDAAICLNDERFKVRAKWRTRFGTRGPGRVVDQRSDDSGLLYFFNEDNWEMLLKVLNACAPPFDRYWVFYAATTNVEFTVTVTDTEAGQTRAYFNPLDNPAPPIQDTTAFATCP